jgi:hypothetical protein
MSKRVLIALMMEAARTSETFVNFYQDTRRYNPEDIHLNMELHVIMNFLQQHLASDNIFTLRT